ncbi:hypothetical protein [Desulfonatronum thioautotrophicum]|uniref:hypothetical protein n=1 Tax=Desulfonatronum thioautotrophicum TaxID=617001 RepID=UPI00069B36EF|nr:hypothetical protein [Desulfonatronum thioautotrophicum]
MRYVWTRKMSMALLALAMLIGLPGVAQVHAVEPETSSAASEEVDFDEVRREMRELAQTLGQYGAEQRDKALERSQPALEALDRRLKELEDALEKNWDEMSEAARERSRQAMRELRRQRIALAEKYGALKTASEGAWEQLREGFLDAFGVLNEAWERSIQEFQEGAEEGDAKDRLTL